MAFLDVNNIHKKFGETEVLRGVSFTLEKGQVLSLIGSSGSGKTTLLRCLNSLESTDEGGVSIDGRPILGKGCQKCDNGGIFGLVFQSFNLFPQYTALENVSLALDDQSAREVKNTGMKFFERKSAMKEKRAQSRAIATELLQKVGLGDKTDLYPCQLSGGQSQRVAIARALALKPQVLCFDEPTSALDPELTGEVLRVIRSLKDKDMTMIIVTHEMEFARSVSDKVIFMADGAIEESGTPQAIFGNPVSDRLKSFLSGFEKKDRD